MNQEKTGRFIAEARNHKGLTQKELAEKIGISDKTISKWECGKSMPDITYLDALCNSLGINMNELISGEYLTEKAYSVKAEENIMALMKENEKTRKGSVIRNIVGILVAILALFFMLMSTGGIVRLPYYYDLPTILMILLLSVACVLLSGKRTYSEILDVLLKVSVPNGVLITFVSIVVFATLNDVSDIGQGVLSIIYALIEYLIVFILRQHIDNRNE